MGLYSFNDWRDYLAHKDASKYDWSTGKNPPDYNHDYYEKHKAEIMAKRKEGVRDFGGAGVGYKAKTDDGKSYENDDDWSDELSPEELKSIQAHNDQVEKNIAEITKTVNDYLAANKGKLSNEQIAKLQKDLATQTEIAREQMISTKNSDDYNYVMDLRKKSGGSGKSSASSSSSGGSSKKSSGGSSKSSSGGSSKSSSGKNDSKNYTEGAKRRKSNQESSLKTLADLKKSDYKVLNERQKNRR